MKQYKSYSWTPELAYAVGLITTDGNLSSDGRHISLTSSDLQLLTTFKYCLGLSNQITKNPKGSYSKKQSYKIQFGDVSFYKWLQEIGLMPHKTSQLNKISVPNEFFRDFLRGHLDGDGSVVTYEDRYNTFKNPKYVYTRLYVNFLSASPKHILWIYQKIKEIINIKGDINNDRNRKRNENKKIVWKLRFAKKASLKLLLWLYYKPYLPCLERKRETATRFLVRFSEAH